MCCCMWTGFPDLSKNWEREVSRQKAGIGPQELSGAAGARREAHVNKLGSDTAGDRGTLAVTVIGYYWCYGRCKASGGEQPLAAVTLPGSSNGTTRRMGKALTKTPVLSPKRVLVLLEVADSQERSWGWSVGWWQESHGALGNQLIWSRLPGHGMSSSVIFFLGGKARFGGSVMWQGKVKQTWRKEADARAGTRGNTKRGCSQS